MSDLNELETRILRDIYRRKLARLGVSNKTIDRLFERYDFSRLKWLIEWLRSTPEATKEVSDLPRPATSSRGGRVKSHRPKSAHRSLSLRRKRSKVDKALQE
ncbi:hypothetical protein GTG28_20540 [Vibrio sp. OCN044]|uniref:Uncharacterized protein n=1 Tax=Vibrio tetraodonis subsp. pristinus TaxID=2695891 RepID=A0A6L8M681_9VIBR|nr:hypothetical protein [Vibrio tetraodonis]MYM61592.1 hypothetical protein [Vibrio tetraodonis subsp. pristinus]